MEATQINRFGAHHDRNRSAAFLEPINITAGARHEHPQTRLQSAVQCHARQPFGAHQVETGGEPEFLHVDLIGFIVSDEDKDTLYLRGVAEACRARPRLLRAARPRASRRPSASACASSPRRNLEKAKAFFDKAGEPAREVVEVPHQGRALSACRRFKRRADRVLRRHGPESPAAARRRRSSLHHGACPQRLDHFQLLVPERPRPRARSA